MNGIKQIVDYMIKQNGTANYYQLSKKLGVSHATVLRWLSGEDKPSAKSCIKLAEISRIPVSYILHITFN